MLMVNELAGSLSGDIISLYLNCVGSVACDDGPLLRENSNLMSKFTVLVLVPATRWRVTLGKTSKFAALISTPAAIDQQSSGTSL